VQKSVIHIQAERGNLK